MKALTEYFDLFMAYILVIGSIILMCIRPDIDVTDILIIAGVWTFGRGFALAHKGGKGKK
jgi:hypothetical protein